MRTVKTAVSLEADLFRQAEDLARRMRLSRSRLFATAVQEFIERWRNRQLLEAVNAAYGDTPAAEARLLRSMRMQHRRRVRGQW